MKQLAWVFFVLCGMSLPAFSAPQYRAGESSPAISSLLHGEISAAYQLSSQKMETKEEDLDTSALKGWDVRALWAPLTWLSVGAEMTQFGDEKMKRALVSSYETNRLAGVVKFTLSPNTSPRVYALVGYGRTEHQLNYDHTTNPIATRKWPGSEKKNIPYWMAGLGVEVNLWKVAFVGVEGNIFRHQTTDLPRYYKTDSKTETALRVRVGVRF